MKKVACPIGTVVMLTYPQPVYAIVIDRGLWLKNANEENEWEVTTFLEGEEKYDKGVMMPLFFLGDIIGNKLITIDEGLVEKAYVQKYGHSNIGKHTHIIGSVSLLLDIIWHIQQATRYSIKYIESALYYIRLLEMYLNGGYDLNSPELPAGHKVLIGLFEKALPGLAGKGSS